jgi:hypothetical protein
MSLPAGASRPSHLRLPPLVFTPLRDAPASALRSPPPLIRAHTRRGPMLAGRPGARVVAVDPETGAAQVLSDVRTARRSLSLLLEMADTEQDTPAPPSRSPSSPEMHDHGPVAFAPSPGGAFFAPTGRK